MAPLVAGRQCMREMPCVGTKIPAMAARAVIRSDQSLSVGATTIVGTTGSSIETSAGVTPSTPSAICNSSSLSVGAVNEIGVGCTVARGCSFCLLLRSLSENCKEGSPERGCAPSRVRQ